MITSLRGHFAGVSVVAALNAVVIGFAAVVLGVPLAGSIAVINFLGAYIPNVGAWTAGIFTVLITLGAEGPESAALMALSCGWPTEFFSRSPADSPTEPVGLLPSTRRADG